MVLPLIMETDFTNGWSDSSKTNLNDLDNVENVYIQNPVELEYTITITAFDLGGDGVPGNSDDTDQDFALVISNAALIISPIKGDPIDVGLNTDPNSFFIETHKIFPGLGVSDFDIKIGNLDASVLWVGDCGNLLSA